MLDEAALRRAEFDEANSVRIPLADGQGWAFPKPFLQVHAKFSGERATGTFPVLTCGPELDELIDALAECEDNEALLKGSATLGAALLCRNYDLDDAALDRLFAIRSGDPSSWDWVRRVVDVATGQGGARSFRGGNA